MISQATFSAFLGVSCGRLWRTSLSNCKKETKLSLATTMHSEVSLKQFSFRSADFKLETFHHSFVSKNSQLKEIQIRITWINIRKLWLIYVRLPCRWVHTLFYIFHCGWSCFEICAESILNWHEIFDGSLARANCWIYVLIKRKRLLRNHESERDLNRILPHLPRNWGITAMFDHSLFDCLSSVFVILVVLKRSRAIAGCGKRHASCSCIP
jgi:hypothetical protein